MSNPAQVAGLNIGHPAPQRRCAHPALLLFVLLGAPASWMTQLLYAFASTSFVCAGAMPRVIPDWLGPAIIILNLIGLTVAVASFVVALGLLKRTIHELRQRSGGVLAAAEGRTRLLAAWGVSISLTFFIATLVNSFSLLLVPLCRF
jgi:hypothetical protein